MKSVHVFVCQCLCNCGSSRLARHIGANVNMLSRVHTFEQVLACCGIEVREADWLFRRTDTMRGREKMRAGESQGQRVIRLFLLDQGNCQALGMKSDYMGV